MNMKFLMAAALAVMTTASVFGAGETTKPRRRPTKPTGGYLLKETAGKCVLIQDRQKVYTEAEVEAVVKKLRMYSQFPVYRNSTGQNAKEPGVTIELVDALDMKGVRVLTAPEQGWAKLGVDWLVADNPADEKRTRRLYVELMRTIGMSMGVGVSMFQPCMMRSVSGVADIDAIKTDKPSPEGCENFATCAKRFGLGDYRYFTYRTACMQGWAPAPTNDVQKAIWEEACKVPDRPLTIEFNKKNGK